MTEQEIQLEEDPYCEMTIRLAQDPESNAGEWGPLFFVTMLVLIVAISSDAPVLTAVGLLIGLSFHDIGQWAGMNQLGYVDKRMLFLPFLRSSVDTQKRQAHGWLYGLIILFGPLPTAVVGAVLSMMSFTMGIKALAPVGFMVASMSVFNLLPLAHFDGGRLLNFVLFCRYPLLEAIFILLTSTCTVVLGIYLHAWILAIFGVIWILNVGRRWRISSAALKIRQEYPQLEQKLPDVDRSAAIALYQAARSVVRPKPTGTQDRNQVITALVVAMREVHSQAILVPPSWGASFLLLFLYGFAMVASVVAIVVAAAMNG